MTKRIISVLLLVMLSLTAVIAYADPAETEDQTSGEVQFSQEELEALLGAQVQPSKYVTLEEEYQGQLIEGEALVFVKSANYENGKLTITLANRSLEPLAVYYMLDGDENVYFNYAGSGQLTQERRGSALKELAIAAGGELELTDEIFAENLKKGEMPKVNILIQYVPGEVNTISQAMSTQVSSSYEADILNPKTAGKMEAVVNFLKQTGFSMLTWKSIVMLLIACLLMYLAIVKKFEPLLLLPIAFGMLLTNLMGAEIFHEEIFAGGHVHWEYFSASNAITPGLIDILYLGVKLGIYPCLIFIGVGAMTDFGPLIANPKSLLLGAAAQIGIFATFIAASFIFTPQEAGSIGIIGGADGPTAIFLTSKLAPHLLGPIAVAAYSYMALVPVIQPPIMKALTTKKERQIAMKELRPVSKTEKIVFPIITTIFVSFLVPSATPLVGALMLGNLLKECGVCERLSKTVQNELMNIVTVFLGISVGATATAETFLSLKTLAIILMGVIAFGVATACGVLLAKFMNLFLKNKINPLIGSAGVSAVPMAARVSQMVGQKDNPSNFLLMHAMGPNVAGVIGSAIAAGALLALLG